MAEAALFTVASKILSTLASPAFATAYERASSVLNAPDELNKLNNTISTIQAGVLDAERKQKESNLVKNWLKRAKEVLYDADDLFDEVATDDLLRRHVKGSNALTRKVRASFSWIVSNDNIALKVRDIREKLLALSKDMGALNLVSCPPENPKEQDPGSFVDPKNVIGRDKDKEAILEMLLHDELNDVQVIAIVGIGGMGKTTLTQLVYNHEEVKRSFEERWFACISDTSDDAEVSRKIYKSIISGEILHSTSDLQIKIKESIEGKKFLLVLDDVWDIDDLIRWKNRMDLLKSGAKGSKILVSTRSSSVASAVGASRTHALCGLSEEDSWDLFKRVVQFTPEQEKDSVKTDIGREIVKKCANVPLAIKWMASLLFGKNDIQEWESLRNIELPRLGKSHKDGIMSVLKLSYEHLPSNLKPCFAYCSLFPKGLAFKKEELIYLWIAQGYVHVNPDNEMQTVEDVGHSYFMDLVRRSLIAKLEDESHGTWYKMHDLIHDLAIHVAGEESCLLTASSNKIKGARHVSVGYVVDGSWPLPDSVNQLRSLLFYKGSRLQVQRKQFANLKSLRALSLHSLQIEDVPDSIGGLKHLRYLDISGNKFKQLPDSITKLVNLCTLNISNCRSLEVWPNSFRKLISLRHLHNRSCLRLSHLPLGCEELPSLQHLDLFVAGKGRSKLDVLSELKLTGELMIHFTDGVDVWDGVEGWQPPLALQELTIYGYKGARIPHWCNKNTSSLPHLVSLTLDYCTRVKCLPPFRHIPNIKRLVLFGVKELEYIEDDEVGSDALFVPDLERLEFIGLPELKGWSRHSSSTCSSPQLLSFPNLSFVQIYKCPKLEWWGEKKSGVDWDSCRKLNMLSLGGFPSSFKIPDCLVHRQQLGQLQIVGGDGVNNTMVLPQQGSAQLLYASPST